MDAAAADAALDLEIDKQLQQLAEEGQTVAHHGRALAVLTVLLSRCSEAQLPAVRGALPVLVSLLDSGDRVVQGNACAALTAAAALDDQLAAAVAATSTERLVGLLQQCCSSGQADLQLNVVAALGQLARDQEATARALLQPQALSSLLAMADAAQPAKLQEAVADGLCALASNEWAREALCEAGAVPAAGGLLSAQRLEVSVRALMVLGMLLAGRAGAQQQLADDAAALQQLMELLKQSEDLDCKIISRDLLGVLMRDEALRGRVEAAVRGDAADAPAEGQ